MILPVIVVFVYLIVSVIAVADASIASIYEMPEGGVNPVPSTSGVNPTFNFAVGSSR